MNSAAPHGLEVKRTKLDDVRLIQPATIFEDFRGGYVELYNEERYQAAGITEKFVQDDISFSSRHVLRGLHGDRKTWKLISCLQGKFYLVVVNWRDGSPQRGQWEAFTLSDQNRQQVLVPPGYGLGHLILSEQAIFHYKQTTYYDRASQFTLLWNDPALNIWWPVKNPILSRRDEGLE
jgi:dTDP-4-dehydrorhamnose 3,5-epimerase